MRIRYAAIAVVLVVALAAGGIAAAIGAGGDEPDDTVTANQGFVGLELADATTLAKEQGRPWRIARQDQEQFVLTDDLNPGRVTFEVDSGVVTGAVIEEESIPSPDDTAVAPDAARAGLIAAALERILTIDNSFGGQPVFDDIRIGTANLEPLDLDTITAELEELGAVQFVADPDAAIQTLFEESPTGVAVVAVDSLFLLDDHAEVELRLWCGSLCGVFLTYEAAPGKDGWEILGATGPIAVS